MNRISRFVGLVLFHGGLAAAPAATPVWKRRAFDLPQSIWSVDALDANRDGRLDVLAVGETAVWAFLAPDWKRVLLAETPGRSPCIPRLLRDPACRTTVEERGDL
jgi:hypothetical protein